MLTDAYEPPAELLAAARAGTSSTPASPISTRPSPTSSDIRVTSHFISRTHARLIRDGNSTVLLDAGSKNGMRVNGRRVRRCELRNGDVISFGGELDLKYVERR